MASVIEVRSVASGFQYSAYKNCSVGNDGVIKESATKVIGGWAMSKEQAREKAMLALEK